MKYFGISLLVFLFVACAVQLKAPTAVDAERGVSRWAGYDSLKLAEGFFIYKNKCIHCHNLHLPKEFTEEKWNTIIPKMAVKAKLTDEQKDWVHKYVLVMAAASMNK